MSVNKDTPEQVTIRPGIGLYALFPSLRYSPWVALGEMVDNSIQSYQEHKEERNAYFRLRNWRKKMIDLGADFLFYTDITLFSR